MQEPSEEPWWRRLDGLPPHGSARLRRFDEWSIRHRLPVAVGAGLVIGLAWMLLVIQSTKPLLLLFGAAQTAAWIFVFNHSIRLAERRADKAQPSTHSVPLSPD